MAKSILVLENGTVFHGEGFGSKTEAVFELVFNTSMTGYQEILTDSSYRGQGVVFTVAHLGNVGINLEDNEADHPQVSALIVGDLSPVVSNWRAKVSLDEWLSQHGIPGIMGVNTRAITHLLRKGGTVKAGVSTSGSGEADLLAKVRAWQGLDGVDMVHEVTCRHWYTWEGDAGDGWVANDIQPQKKIVFPGQPTVVVLDYGVKRNMIRHLAAWGAKVIVVPANSTAEKILEFNPDGILLSNGPGDPAGLPYAVHTVKDLLCSNKPIFGICLGHQLLGRALGADTKRLKFGHHGGNHPVHDIQNNKVLITAQNHNFVVDMDTLKSDQVQATHFSLNDRSLEGMCIPEKGIFSVQFHPEAAPGPHDAHGLFYAFFQAINESMRK